MSGRAYTKRNRPVTACRECHRRKQKCDRQKPCNFCLGRNVPEKCLYGDDLLKLVHAPKTREQNVPLTPPSDHELPIDEQITTSEDRLEEQIGYSSLSDNAFIDLYESIDAIRTPSAVVAKTPLPKGVTEKYFRIVTQLPSQQVCATLVDTYFTEADWYFMALDRYFFDRLYAAWDASRLADEDSLPLELYPRDLQHFPALLFQVLAVGLHFSRNGSEALSLLKLGDRGAIDRQSQLYSDFGCEIMTILGRQHASIAGVEQDIMRTTWLKNCSRGTESWHSIGNAISMAHDLELHVESDLLSSNDDRHVMYEQLWYDEYKRRVWSRVFLLDSHMALVLGRPRHIHLDDCTVEWPTDCDIPENLSQAKPRPPEQDEQPSSFTFILFLVQIGVKIHEMMSAKSKKAYANDWRKVDKVHQDVEALMLSLPPAMRPLNPDTSWDQQKPHLPKVRQQIFSTANSFLMKLHRPYVNFSEASRNAVITASLGTLDAQRDLFESMQSSVNQHRIYGFSFYTIDAAILLSAVVINRCPKDPDVAQHVNRSLLEAIGRLSRLKDTSRVAASGEVLLQQCYSQIAARQINTSEVVNTTSTPSLCSDRISVPSDYSFLDDFNSPEPKLFDPNVMSDTFNAAEYFMNYHTQQL